MEAQLDSEGLRMFMENEGESMMGLEDDRATATTDDADDGKGRGRGRGGGRGGGGRSGRFGSSGEKKGKSDLEKKKDKLKQRARALHDWSQDTKIWSGTLKNSTMPPTYVQAEVEHLQTWQTTFTDFEERCQELLVNFDEAVADQVLADADNKRSEYLELVQRIKRLTAVPNKKPKKAAN